MTKKAAVPPAITAGPHVPALMHSLGQLNSFVFARCLYSYQRIILEAGELAVASPWSGRMLTCAGGIILPSGMTGYAFDDGDRSMWIGACNLGWGYPLSWIYVPLLDEFAPIASGHAKGLPGRSEQVMLRKMESIRRHGECGGQALPPGPILVVGDKNFAHLIWNELAGLEKWVAAASPQSIGKLSIMALHQPFGPLHALMPELSGCGIADAGMQGKFLPPSSLPTRVGSTIVTKAVRQIVSKYAAANASPQAKAVAAKFAGYWPLIWMSVRSYIRACENQTEFLAALIERISHEYPTALFLIDGFSLPNDISGAQYDDARKNFERKVATERAIVEDLRTIALLDDKTRLLNLVGLSLTDSIGLASHADFYVTHAGTIQHKIAWIHDKPGMIHTCTPGLSAGSRSWYARQVEDGIAPSVADPRHIVDTSFSSKKAQQSRNIDYRIANVGGLVGDILDDMKSAIGTR